MMISQKDMDLGLADLHVQGIPDVEVHHLFDPLESTFQHMMDPAPVQEEAA